MTKQAMGELVTYLERGYVDRIPDPNDRRASCAPDGRVAGLRRRPRAVPELERRASPTRSVRPACDNSGATSRPSRDLRAGRAGRVRARLQSAQDRRSVWLGVSSTIARTARGRIEYAVAGTGARSGPARQPGRHRRRYLEASSSQGGLRRGPHRGRATWTPRLSVPPSIDAEADLLVAARQLRSTGGVHCWSGGTVRIPLAVRYRASAVAGRLRSSERVYRRRGEVHRPAVADAAGQQAAQLPAAKQPELRHRRPVLGGCSASRCSRNASHVIANAGRTS